MNTGLGLLVFLLQCYKLMRFSQLAASTLTSYFQVILGWKTHRWHQRYLFQRILPEGEILVQLTSLYQLIQISCFYTKKILFYKTGYHNEKVSRTEPPPSVRVPRLQLYVQIQPNCTTSYYHKLFWKCKPRVKANNTVKIANFTYITELIFW